MTDRADLRPLLPAAAAWVAAWLAWTPGRAVGLVAVGLGVVGLLVALFRGRARALPAAVVLAAAAGSGAAALHVVSVRGSPVAELATLRAPVVAVAVLRADPVARPGGFGSTTSVEADVVEIGVRGRAYQVNAPVLVVVRSGAELPERGSRVRIAGTLTPSQRPERAAVLVARAGVEVLAAPGATTAWGNRVRRAVRDAVAEQDPGPRALVPALVDGQDGALPPSVVEDFRTVGMTHLLAVSGTNLTLIVGFLLVVARWVGVRARWLVVVGLLGVLGFLVLAGGEPSVLRAAAMGTIALVGLGHGGRERGVRALGVGVLVLVLVDPPLARSPGFALSVVATGAILLLVPRWRDALGRWLPRWAAEAVAVPLAAQVACTPLVAALSGQVSLVAVAANLAAAPLVAPATVAGLLGGLVALGSVPLGRLVAAPAGWAAHLLIAIATRSAAVSLPSVGWGTSAAALLLLVALCLGLAALLHRVLARRGPTLLLAGVMVVVVLVPLPTPGWPPAGWVAVVCSVGQGDAVVLRVSERAAVVVDAGPESRPVDRCLRRLRISEIPVLVLTHLQNA